MTDLQSINPGTPLSSRISSVKSGILHRGPKCSSCLERASEQHKLPPDYNRFEDLPDKKTSENAAKFMMLNEVLKVGLPKFSHLVGTVMLTCLEAFVAIRQEWYPMILQKLSSPVDDIPHDFLDVVSHWSAKFGPVNARIESLDLLNGALMLPIPQPRPIDHDLSSLSVDNNAGNTQVVEASPE